jgi:hypothetical protein
MRPSGVPSPTSFTSLMAAWPSPKLGQAGFHGHSDGGAHFDGVHAEVVIQAIQHGDGIQVVDAAVAAVGPDGFVLGLFGQKLPFLS